MRDGDRFRAACSAWAPFSQTGAKRHYIGFESDEKPKTENAEIKEIFQTGEKWVGILYSPSRMNFRQWMRQMKGSATLLDSEEIRSYGKDASTSSEKTPSTVTVSDDTQTAPCPEDPSIAPQLQTVANRAYKALKIPKQEWIDLDFRSKEGNAQNVYRAALELVAQKLKREKRTKEGEEGDSHQHPIEGRVESADTEGHKKASHGKRPGDGKKASRKQEARTKSDGEEGDGKAKKRSRDAEKKKTRTSDQAEKQAKRRRTSQSPDKSHTTTTERLGIENNNTIADGEHASPAKQTPITRSGSRSPPITSTASPKRKSPITSKPPTPPSAGSRAEDGRASRIGSPSCKTCLQYDK